MDTQDDHIENKFIETETRTFPILKNLWKHSIPPHNGPINEKKKDAAISAFLHWALARSARAASFAVIGGGISITAIASVFIALKANQLLETQNKLSEAQRRAISSQEITEIYNSIYQAIDIDNKKELTPVLEARIVAILNSSRPYRYLDLEQSEANTLYLKDSNENQIQEITHALTEKDLNLSPLTSPERGQIITLLHQSRVNYSNILGRSKIDFADLANADLEGISLTTNPPKEISMQRAILSAANLSNSTLIRVNLSHSDLRGADFSGAIVEKLICEECNLSELPINNLFKNGTRNPTYLRFKIFSEGGFINSNLNKAILDKSHFKNATFYSKDGTTNLQDTDISQTIFEDDTGKTSTIDTKTRALDYATSGLWGDESNKVLLDRTNGEAAQFIGHTWLNVSATYANFSKAIFSNTVIENSDLSNSNLRHSTFKSSNIINTKLHNTDIYCTDFSTSLIPINEIPQSKNWINACFSKEQEKALGTSLSNSECHCSKN